MKSDLTSLKTKSKKFMKELMKKVSTMGKGKSLKVGKSMLDNSALVKNMEKGNMSIMKQESLTKELMSLVSFTDMEFKSWPTRKNIPVSLKMEPNMDMEYGGKTTLMKTQKSTAETGLKE